MQKNQKGKEEGLPEIAQRLREKKPIVFVMLGIIGLAIVSMFFLGKSNKKSVQPIEESYSIQQPTESQVVKPLQANVQPETKTDPVVLQQQAALIQAKKNELQQRLTAPLMVVSNSGASKTDASAQANVSQSSDMNTQFMTDASSKQIETALATIIGPLNAIIAQGSFIHAILEPATNSDLPGFVRAVVSEPCYSEDGTQILIPIGSRLLGQYKSGMLQGQSRIFMVWTRVITPSGVSIQLGSEGVDSLGVAGIGADHIDRHFWERFSNASLLSIIGAGTANVGVSSDDQENSAATFRTAIANSFSQSANQTLQEDIRIPPTLTTDQGKPIMVFVAKDLNFQSAIKQARPKVNVF